MCIQGSEDAIVAHQDNVPVIIVGDDIKSALAHGIQHLQTDHQRGNTTGDVRRRLLVIYARIDRIGPHSKGPGDQVGVGQPRA